MKNIYQLITIVVFLVMISLPVIGHHYGWDETVNLNENRSLAKAPDVSLKNIWEFSNNYVSYFNDNFGFRTELLELSHLINIKVFKTAPPKSGVTIGRDGWLFYTPDDTYLDTLNAQPFSDTELSQITSNLETIRQHFADQGIHFYFMVSPNAQTIYPEELPSSIKKVSPQSRLDQLTDYLKSHQAKVAFINPVNDLKQQKPKAQLYYKYDTHWDDYGAFIAYRSLINRISTDFSNISPKNLNDFTISQGPAQHKDLELLLGVSDYYHENVPVFSSNDPNTPQDLIKECPDPYAKCGKIVKKIPGSNLPTAVIYRDSFFTAMIPFLSENFSQSTYLWGVTPYSTELLKTEKTNVVIFEITERELWRLPQKLFDFQN